MIQLFIQSLLLKNQTMEQFFHIFLYNINALLFHVEGIN